MRIISWNTNGIRATVKQGHFFPLFKKYKPDVVCLQETKAEEIQLTDATKNIAGYYSYFSHSQTKKGYSGVAIYTKEKPQKVFYDMGLPAKQKHLDVEGRILGVKLKSYTVITGYFPNGGSGPHRLEYKLEFYDAFLKFINKLRANGEHVIFCGDVNTAHTEIDLARPKANVENTGFLPIERAWITKVIKNNFLDVWRELNPNKKDVYTYWDQKTASRTRNVGWRIDYFFADAPLMKKIKSASMLTDYMGSDHCPIVLEIK